MKQFLLVLCSFISSAVFAGSVEVFPVTHHEDGTEITSTVFYQISYNGAESAVQESREFPLSWEPGKQICAYAIADSVRSAAHCIIISPAPVPPKIKLLIYMESAL